MTIMIKSRKYSTKKIGKSLLKFLYTVASATEYTML